MYVFMRHADSIRKYKIKLRIKPFYLTIETLANRSQSSVIEKLKYVHKLNKQQIIDRTKHRKKNYNNILA